MRGFFVLLLCGLLASMVWASAYEDEEDDAPDLPPVSIPEVRDFSAVGEQAKDEGRVIMLLVSQVHCPYCVLIKEDIIHPMLRGRDYADQLLIRELYIDRSGSINDFSGKPINPLTFAKRHGAGLTPTLLFLDAQGNELTERMIGINTPEMYFYYVDEAIKKALVAQKN